MTTFTAGEVRARLLGAWHLASWQSTGEDGAVTYPWGREVTGLLVYDGSGRMSGQLVRTGQPRFASDDWRVASPDEMTRAWPAYFGYFGTFTIDAARGVITHHVESGWFPNLAGTEQIRRYAFEEGRLVLDSDTAWGRVRLAWVRVQPGPLVALHRR